MSCVFLFFRNKKSARRDSNPRPRPWQGRAPPTEPLAHIVLKYLSSTKYNILYVPLYVNTFFNFFYFSQVRKIALSTYWLLGKFLWVISSKRIKSTSSQSSSATTIKWENITPKFISSYFPRWFKLCFLANT